MSQRRTYLVTEYNLHSDLRMRACASDLSLKLRIGDDLTYYRAVLNFTHTESEIRAQAMSAVLASTISIQSAK